MCEMDRKSVLQASCETLIYFKTTLKSGALVFGWFIFDKRYPKNLNQVSYIIDRCLEALQRNFFVVSEFAHLLNSKVKSD